MSAGHGGQILLAASTAEHLDGIDLIDLGRRQLRDLSETLQIFQVRAAGLRTDFPPLKTIDTVPGNLPAQATSFIGRDAEVKELTDLMHSHRLVTLTGVGGRRQDAAGAARRRRTHGPVRRRRVVRGTRPGGRSGRRARCCRHRPRSHGAGGDDGQREPGGRLVRSAAADRDGQLRARARCCGDDGRDDPRSRRDGERDGDLARSPRHSSRALVAGADARRGLGGGVTGGGALRRARPSRPPDVHARRVRGASTR